MTWIAIDRALHSSGRPDTSCRTFLPDDTASRYKKHHRPVEIVDRADIRVVELRTKLRLALESFEVRGLLG